LGVGSSPPPAQSDTQRDLELRDIRGTCRRQPAFEHDGFRYPAPGRRHTNGPDGVSHGRAGSPRRIVDASDCQVRGVGTGLALDPDRQQSLIQFVMQRLKRSAPAPEANPERPRWPLPRKNAALRQRELEGIYRKRRTKRRQRSPDTFVRNAPNETHRQMHVLGPHPSNAHARIKRALQFPRDTNRGRAHVIVDLNRDKQPHVSSLSLVPRSSPLAPRSSDTL